MATDRVFDPRRVKRWRRDIWRAFEREGFKPTEIIAATVFAAVSSFGTDVGVLSEVTGSSPEYIKKVLKRLRSNRLLSGQTLRSCGHGRDGFDERVGETLDAGVAAGIFQRSVNQKRSDGQKARAPETRATGPRRRAVVTPGAVFTPKRTKSNPLIGLPEWSKEGDTKR